MSTVRISDSGHSLLRKLSRSHGVSMQVIMDDALENYRRERLLREANEAFSRLRKDAKRWKEEQKERQAWEQTLSDDIE